MFVFRSSRRVCCGGARANPPVCPARARAIKANSAPQWCDHRARITSPKKHLIGAGVEYFMQHHASPFVRRSTAKDAFFLYFTLLFFLPHFRPALTGLGESATHHSLYGSFIMDGPCRPWVGKKKRKKFACEISEKLLDLQPRAGGRGRNAGDEALKYKPISWAGLSELFDWCVSSERPSVVGI